MAAPTHTNLAHIAELIRKATKGFFRTNEQALLEAVVRLSKPDLGRLNEFFQSQYKKSLTRVIEKRTGGPFGKLLAGSVQIETAYAAKTIHNTLKTASHKEHILAEVPNG